MERMKDGVGYHRQHLLGLESHRPQYTECATALGASLHDLFLHTGNIGLLDEAIHFHRSSLVLIPDQSLAKAITLDSLIPALYGRHTQAIHRSDLDDTVSVHRTTLEIQAQNRECTASGLRKLSATLTAVSQYHPFNDEPLEEAIADFRLSLLSYEPLELKSAPSLYGLSEALMLRYWATGRTGLMEEAIRLSKSAAGLSSSPLWSLNFIASRVSLGRAVKDRFVKQGVAGDSSEALEALEAAPNPSYPGQWKALTALADVLILRGFKSQSTVKLSKAKDFAQRAVDLCQEGHFYRARAMLALAGAAQFFYSTAAGSEDLLYNTVALHRACLASASSQDSQLCVAATANLGASIHACFRIQGLIEDIDEGICLLTRRIKLLPVPYLNYRHMLQDLANLHEQRFRAKGEVADSDASIRIRRQVLALCPVGELRRTTYMANLALSLTSAATILGKMEYLSEAASVAREALDSVPEQSHYQYAGLGTILQTAWKHGVAPDGLELAIHLYESILSVIVTGHSRRAEYLSGYASNLLMRFRTMSEPTDLRKCMEAYREAVLHEESAIQDRFEAVQSWIDNAEEIGAVDFVPEAYSRAVALFPRIAYLALNPKQRVESLKLLRDIPRFVQRGAMHFVKQGHAEAAVELLEEGRCVP
jgi:hypothetical protein